MRRVVLVVGLLISAGLALAAYVPQHRRFMQPNMGRSSAHSSGDGSCTNCCIAQPTTCTVTSNLLTAANTWTISPWVLQSGGAAAPTLTTNYDADPAGGWSAARVQFAAVTAGQESTLWQRIAADACAGISCRYSMFVRATPDGTGPSTGNLPVATASNGGDGFQPTNCAFTANWSRCDFTIANAGGSSYFWIGYASYGAGYSGDGPAMDLELWLPSAVVGTSSATYACTTTNNDKLSKAGFTNAQVTADWGIEGRDGAGLVTTYGAQVLLGGWNGIPPAGWNGRATTNQVKKSTDQGATWAAILAHQESPAQNGCAISDSFCRLDSGVPMWTRRHSMGVLTATVGGTEYIYVIGGDHLNTDYGGTSGPYPTDVWRSPANGYGAAWERMTATAEWGSRMGHIVWAIGSTLYVAGGQTDLLDPATALHDVWKSVDGGATWTLVGNAPWVARGFISNALPTFNGKVWLTGGLRYANDIGDRVHYNDVWSYDGTTWTEFLACAPWSPRGYLNSVSFGGRLWIIRGAYGATVNGEAWSTDGGAVWSRYPGAIAAQGHAGSVAVNDAGTVLSIEGDALAGEKGVWSVTAP